MNKINHSELVPSSLLAVELIDDFIGLDTTRWNTLAADAATAIAEDADGVNGLVTIYTGSADNGEAYLFLNEITKFTAGKPFWVFARLQFTEANSDDANVIFGVGEGFGGANTLQDNGAGPPADYDGVCLFKVDGGTRWQFESSYGTTQTTSDLDVTAGGSSFQTIGILCEPISSTEIEATPLIDPLGGNNADRCYEYNANPSVQAKRGTVKHRFTYSTVGEMALCIGAKSGAGTQPETIVLDLVVLTQKR